MNRKAVAVIAGAALAALLLHACTPGQEIETSPEPRPVPVPDVQLERSVPSPVVLLHGLGGDSHSWKGLRAFFKDRELRDGGVVQIGPGGEPQFSGGEVPPEKADFFTLTISNPYQSLQAWTAELEKLLEAIHRQTGEAHVVLVGHSAGGLTGRKYVVEHPRDHHLAKLVTVASPHRGSNLALLPLALRKLRDAVSRGDEIGLVSGPMNQILARLERSANTPLDSPILEDLKPEDLNPDLAALNRSAHPDNVEYGCLRALGDPAPEHWDNLKKFVTGKIRAREVDWNRVAQDVTEILRGENSFQGDGAVSVASQDLSRIDFFGRHPTWIRECRGVNVGHSEIKEEYQEILTAITSPVRILRVRRESDDSLVVDFHDYFAGKAEIKVSDARTGAPLDVSSPAVFKRRDEPADPFGRVTTAPLGEGVDAVDIVMKSLDGRRYGQRILLTTGARGLPPHKEPEPIVLKLLRIENIPKGSPFPFGDDNGWRSDLMVLLTVNEKRLLTTDPHRDVGASANFNREVRIDIDPEEAWITLELWDVDFDDPSDLMGKISLTPGMLLQGPVAVRTDQGIVVRLEVELPIQWEKDPIVLQPDP